MVYDVSVTRVTCTPPYTALTLDQRRPPHSSVVVVVVVAVVVVVVVVLVVDACLPAMLGY